MESGILDTLMICKKEFQNTIEEKIFQRRIDDLLNYCIMKPARMPKTLKQGKGI